MDFVTGLAAVGQAIKIAKDLRQLDMDLDAATVKAQTAELYSSLADVKMALTDARHELHEKEQKIRDLEAKVKILEFGDICPLCRNSRMKVVKSEPYKMFASLVQIRTLTCENSDCGHSERKLFDPDGLVKRNASK